ncbi:hypothetical protein T08_15583, partial [Trichinella sp. T8]
LHEAFNNVVDCIFQRYIQKDQKASSVQQHHKYVSVASAEFFLLLHLLQIGKNSHLNG